MLEQKIVSSSLIQGGHSIGERLSNFSATCELMSQDAGRRIQED
jgi:hypothetical protein